MSDREVRVRLVVTGGPEFQRQMQGAGQATQQLGQSAQGVDKASSSMVGFVKKAAAIVGVGAAITSTAKTFGDFEQSLNQLQATGNATGAQMQQVSEKARELGKAVAGMSATDAANAMMELAKGGLSVDQAMTAATGTLQLAAAAQTDAATAAQIQSNALDTFGLAASDASKVADVLADTANAASGDIEDFAQGLAQAGLPAKSLGISLEDTSTALGIFANNGLSGSDAGTSLKMMLISLTKPSKDAQAALDELGVTAFDAQGQFVGLEAISGQLAAAQQRMTTEQYNAAAATAFGTDALRAAVAFAESGTAGYQQMATAVSEVGGAQKMAEANTVGLNGAIDAIKASVEDAQIALGEKLAPAATEVATRISEIVPKLVDDLGPALTSIGEVALSAVDVLGTAISTATTLITPLVDAVSVLAQGFAGLPAPAQAAILALGAMVIFRGPMAALGAAAARTRGAFVGFGEQMRLQAALAASAGQQISRTSALIATAGIRAKAAGAALLGAFGGPWGLAIGAGITALTLFAGGQEKAATETADFTDIIDDQTGALVDNAQAISAKKLADVGALDAAKNAGISTELFTKAVLGEGAARDQVAESIRAQMVARVRADAESRKSIISMQLEGKTAAEIEAAIGRAADAKLRLAETTTDLADATDPLLNAWHQLYVQGGQVDEAHRKNALSMEGSGKAASAAAAEQERYLAQLERQSSVLKKAAPDQEQISRNLTSQQRLLGSAAAEQDRYVSSLERAGAAVEAAGGGLPQYRYDIDTAAAGMSGFATAVGDVETAADRADTSVQGLVTSIEALINPGKVNEDWAQDYAEAILDVAKAQRDGAKATDDVKRAEENLASVRGDSDSSPQDIADAERSLADAKADTVRVVGDETDATDKLRKSRSESIDRAYAEALATGDTAKAAKVASDRAKELGDDLVKNHAKYGLSKEGAQALNKELGLTPENIKTVYQSNAEQAKAAGLEVYKVYDSTTGTWTGQFLTQGDAEALQKSGALVQKYNEATGTWTATLGVNDQASEPARRIKGELDAIPRSIATVVTVSKRGAVASGGMFTDQGVQYFPGYARGGILPGATPANGKDNLLGVGPGGPIAVQSGEFLMNSRQTKANEKWLWWMNSGGVLPGFADGGIPGFNFAGTPARQLGQRESLTVGALGDLSKWVKDLADAASKAREELTRTNSSLLDQRQAEARNNAERAESMKVLQRENAEKLAAAKTDAQRAIVTRENAQRVEALTKKQEKAAKIDAAKTAALEAQSKAERKAYDVAQARAKAEAAYVRSAAGTLAKLRETSRAIDANQNKLTVLQGKAATARGNLQSARADKASMIASLGGTIAGYGGGITGFADQRTTGAAIVAGARFNAAQIKDYGADLRKLAGMGASKSVLAQLSTGDEDAMSRARILAGSGKSILKQLNAADSAAQAYGRQAAAVSASKQYDGQIAKLTTAYQEQVKAVQGQQKVIAGLIKTVETLDSRIAKGIDRGFDLMASEAGRPANR